MASVASGSSQHFSVLEFPTSRTSRPVSAGWIHVATWYIERITAAATLGRWNLNPG
jgi:hypothetical protein